MRDFFELDRHHTTITTEVIAGITTFLSVSYILTTNPTILKDAGMPFAAVFVSTGLSAGICTLAVSLFSRTPFAVAPGMSMNTFFAYTICIGLGFHWREAMAVTFLAGMAHIAIMLSPLRKSLVRAIPEYLRFSINGGIGLFIAYVGMKNANLLSFTAGPDHYVVTESGVSVADSLVIPSLVEKLSYAHLVTFCGFLVTIFLLALERKTGDKYGAFLIGIISATFVGIPLSVTDVSELQLLNFSTLENIRDVAFSFFGDPGLLTLFANPLKMSLGVLCCLTVTMTNIFDSITSTLGSSQTRDVRIFDNEDMKAFFEKPGLSSNLDRTLAANSFGGVVASLAGSSTCTVYIESVTGIASGGRSGLTSLIVGICFLCCIPLVSFFRIIPAEAVAPALIVSGLFLFALVTYINWDDIEESIPAGLTIMFIPITYSVLSGVTVGFVSHIVIQLAYGKGNRLNPFLLTLTAGLVLLNTLHHLL